MKILISGFERFGRRSINQSEIIAERFIGESDINVMILPVSFSNAHKILIKELETNDYDLIIMLGESSATNDTVRLERVALNLKDSTGCDNDGILADEEEIINDGATAYFSTFPVKRTVSSLKEKGFKVKTSNSAGTYVCNNVYYNILHYLSENKLQTAALFVHLPSSTDQIDLNEMQQTIHSIIEEYHIFEDTNS